MYGKQTETAIAAMSRLAEVYDKTEARLSAADIADERGLLRPSVAKVLTVLSQAGLVGGSPGPGGGYQLARPPKEITLYEVFQLFEREDDSRMCPFGGGECGVGEKCAVHDRLVNIQKARDRLLHDTTFDAFRVAYRRRMRAGGTAAQPTPPARRESYRATSRS